MCTIDIAALAISWDHIIMVQLWHIKYFRQCHGPVFGHQLKTLSSSVLECGRVRIRSAAFDILQFHKTSTLAPQSEELILDFQTLYPTASVAVR